MECHRRAIRYGGEGRTIDDGLTRLLGVPARYRVGYIHTGADYDNKIQSEASHAWAEVYLPWIGWRSYQDATPTSGTLYKTGGGRETLDVKVRVELVDDNATADRGP